MTLPYLSREDLTAARPADHDVLSAVRRGIEAHARGQTIAHPTLSLAVPGAGGAVYTIRGALTERRLLGIKSVGSFPANRDAGLPPDPGLFLLHDSDTGVPLAILEGSFVTTTRTAAMTALGAILLARSGARVLGVIGARGIAPLAARMIRGEMELEEIRIHSASPETRAAAARSLATPELRVDAVDSWTACVDGADIVIDGPGLTCHQALLPSCCLGKGATVISYGAFSSYDDEILDNVERLVMDRWAEGGSGPLGPFVSAGRVHETDVDAWFGNIVIGEEPARQTQEERVLLWHRGLAACDITLAETLIARAADLGLGTPLTYP